MHFATTSAAEGFKPAPGCKSPSALRELERSLKGERKIAYDHKTNPIRMCDPLQPLIPKELRWSGQSEIAIIVFDVTGSGRVVEQQVIGPKTPWAKVCEKTLAQKLWEPLVEGDVGTTRVGVTMTFVAEFANKTQSCGRVKSVVKPDLEMRICGASL